MKLSIIAIPAILCLSILACRKEDELPAPQPQRELSVPEKVEREVVAVLSKDWQSLSDTLDYFNRTMLLKGKTRGTGPDGVYYELKTRITPEFRMTFTIEDYTWLELRGKLIPTDLKFSACAVQIGIRTTQNDTTSFSACDIEVLSPKDFLTSREHQAPLLYQGERVGYMTRETFENLDYSTGTYIVIHYYDDPRTFAIYDNGLGSLLMKNLKNVNQ